VPETQNNLAQRFSAGDGSAAARSPRGTTGCEDEPGIPEEIPGCTRSIACAGIFVPSLWDFDGPPGVTQRWSAGL